MRSRKPLSDVSSNSFADEIKRYPEYEPELYSYPWKCGKQTGIGEILIFNKTDRFGITTNDGPEWGDVLNDIEMGMTDSGYLVNLLTGEIEDYTDEEV